MRDTMRQLLGRKSNPRMSAQETPNSRPGAYQQAGDLANERVFPLRNVRSIPEIVEPATNMKNGASKLDDEHIEHSIFPGPPRSPTPQSMGSVTRDDVEQRKVSERSHFIPTKSGPLVFPESLSDKNKPNPPYRRCEDEPIHTPGAIQSFGALLGLKYREDGQLEVRIASENSRKVLGYGPEQLFALSSFLDILKHDVQDEMVAHIKHALSNPDEMKGETRLDIFQMVLTFPYEPDLRLWCAIHLAPNTEGLVICEFEDYSDAFYRKDLGAAKALPVTPVGFMDVEVSPEELERSTTNASKPLPVIEISHRKQNKAFSSLDLFNAMAQAQQQISGCKSVQNLLEVVVGLISELTGFHRVMAYRFDSQKNGAVDAELLNPQACTDVFRGLHYPASDIPKQARELYKINRIRILHDRDGETARLVCRNEKDFKRPIDLTHAYLRAISPVHLHYLANMGVQSTMSISLIINSELWGLIACHGYGDVGIKVSLPIRELCRNIGEYASMHIQRLTMQQRLDARRPSPATYPSVPNPANLVDSSSPDLLKLVDADFALLSIGEKTRTIGKLDPYREAMAIVSYLQSCQFTQIRCSHNINADFPGLGYPPGLKTICGLLLIPLSVGGGSDFLVFFRKSEQKLVKWAGKPHEKTFKPGSHYLEPRNSFQRWVETIEGTSREWTEDQLDTGYVLGMLYSQYAKFKHTETEDSHVQAIDETFNLNRTISKLKEALQKEARQKALDLTISVPDQLPATVKGDPDRLRQLIIYFTSNAFKRSKSVKVEINIISMKDDTSMIGLVFQDTGPGLTEEELDDTFQEFEEAQDAEHWPLPAKEPATNLSDANGGTRADLAAVAQYVRNVNGQIRVTSKMGRGTMFSVELPFQHVQSEAGKSRKLRNIFLPSVGSSKNSPPSPAPFMKSPRPNHNEIQRRAETPPHSERSYSPRARIQRLEEEHGSRPGAYAHALDRYSPEGLSLYPDMDDSGAQVSSNPLNVLIVEDNPISLRMLEKRLSNRGHTVDVATDGQEAHDLFSSNSSKIDVILMDLKMPLVDGVLSTRMIRLLEKESKYSLDTRQPLKSQDSRQRVPIIAVSSALYEESRFDYIQNGFDGWILKPMDFQRLELILQGVKSPEFRRDLLYVPGQWEKGGWFLP